MVSYPVIAFMQAIVSNMGRALPCLAPSLARDSRSCIAQPSSLREAEQSR
jgi:hypothetical protein